MNKDMNKFKLVAYEKNNISNRKELKLKSLDKNGKNIIQDKYFLSTIDMYTSSFLQYQLYDKLLKQSVIKKEQTEFVIWYKEKNVIKQLPVIYNNMDIRVCSAYVHGIEGKEIEDFYKSKTKETFAKFIRRVEEDSKKYDKLSIEEKNNYMNGNSFSARFIRMPFAKADFKNSVKDRILGICRDKSGIRIKGGKDYSNNFGNIMNNIETSYRCFRDAYLMVEKNNNYENTHKDLNYNNIINQIIEKTNDIEELKIIKIEATELQNEKKYNYIDFENLLINSGYKTRVDFGNFAYQQAILPKKVRNAIYEIMDSAQGESEYDICKKINILLEYDSKNHGVFGDIVSQYYEFNKNAQNKELQKVISR